jgi:penicillin amidase
VLLLALVVAAAGGILAWWRVWWAMPQVTGHIPIAGLSAPVEVLRDADGVPHVRAVNVEDALCALGFLHAQDRLWQMEFQRRIGHGRLAEVLGPAALPNDRLFRTVGFSQNARAMWAAVSPAARARVEAYVRGVNAFLDTHAGARLPVEFSLLGVAPEPWRPEDVLVWGRVMSWELSTNWRDELLRARIVARAGEDAAEALLPASTDGSPVVVQDAAAPAASASGQSRGRTRSALPPGALAEVARSARALASLDLIDTAIAASNNWVVSGARTETGRPLLANDPHLGTQMPSLWYLAHLQGGPLDVIGATLPGLPGVIIGHNARIAWGVTNVMTDNQDLFVERINSRNEALHVDAWEPMAVRTEVIRVKGQADEVLTVRTTRHGPLVSDVLPGSTQALAFSWSALATPDSSFEVWLVLDLARSWTEFEAALSRFRAPMQNFVYADVDGNIGYFAPGAIPIRPTGDGRLPVPGWTGDHDWTGEVPSSLWPRMFNPARGFIVSANNPVVPEGYPYPISTNWEPGYRAARITELIEGTPRLSVDGVARMQADVRSGQARFLLPWLLRARPTDGASQRALEQLRTWDGTLLATSPQAAIYEAWLARAAAGLFADELGDELWRDYKRQPHWVAKSLHHVVAHGADRWCDDVRSQSLETCEETLGRTLSEALGDLSARLGENPSAWQWGRDNEVWFPHLPLHFSPVLRPLASRSVRSGGDSVTVNPVMRVGDRIIAPSYRQIVDLADLDRSRFVLTTGQSGQPGSRHYADQLPRWSSVSYLPMRFSRTEVDRAVDARLVLDPAPEPTRR